MSSLLSGLRFVRSAPAGYLWLAANYDRTQYPRGNREASCGVELSERKRPWGHRSLWSTPRRRLVSPLRNRK
jgi:hypothetical protein